MDRSNIKDLRLTRVAETLVSECERTKNCQENPKPADRFHLYSLSGLDSAELGRDTQTKDDGMICTKVFFCNIILEAAKKQVCAIEHTFTFSLHVRPWAQYQHCGSVVFWR
jgi:hypothetical protein